VYRSVRRHLWRKVVREHRICCNSACSHLTWSMNGTTTKPFCAAAVAYLRWRMFWEGVSTPAELRSQPRNAPIGLITWQATYAPIGAASWSSRSCTWLSSHVLGSDLMGSFWHALHHAQSARGQALVSWEKGTHSDLERCGWICAGRGTVVTPLRLYILRTPQSRKITKRIRDEHTKSHRRWNARQIKSITH
jgi:hypothetical protein